MCPCSNVISVQSITPSVSWLWACVQALWAEAQVHTGDSILHHSFVWLIICGGQGSEAEWAWGQTACMSWSDFSASVSVQNRSHCGRVGSANSANLPEPCPVDQDSQLTLKPVCSIWFYCSPWSFWLLFFFLPLGVIIIFSIFLHYEPASFFGLCSYFVRAGP